MDRREFLRLLAMSGGIAASPAFATAPLFASGKEFDRLLILLELKGGNDGLNTVVPMADPAYYKLRPRIAIQRDQVIPLSAQSGFHPSLSPLLESWQSGELAIIQGLGYPSPNLSHFRSIEIWDTASASQEYLSEGWLARTFSLRPPPGSFAADGMVIGVSDLGPLLGGRRVVTLSDPAQFARQAKLATGRDDDPKGALGHILRVESDIRHAAIRINPQTLAGSGIEMADLDLPVGAFGKSVETATQVLAGSTKVAVMRLTLGGFDTHQNQPATHANLLKQFALGLNALRSVLIEGGLWKKTLILSYSEFGRRPQENRSNGTDHGTASVHFALGGGVRGGFCGEPPDLSRLDATGNLVHAIDFRSLYATVLDRWWGVDSASILGERFAPLDILV